MIEHKKYGSTNDIDDNFGVVEGTYTGVVGNEETTKASGTEGQAIQPITKYKPNRHERRKQAAIARKEGKE